MGMNLHQVVRGAITAVNPDMVGIYRASTGYTVDGAGNQTPTYATDAAIDIQVQALTWKDLQHRDMQNIQGVARACYVFGNKQGVARPNVQGGDLLLFPQNVGDANSTWLVVAVLETWTPDAAGWCKVGMVLQLP
jgi:hypothetical protein